ncbi:MAG TPA: sulfatase [Solirubrobacteraceae bacterium]|nr:sulfatase [Solirubrobacteraceae bacterium]
MLLALAALAGCGGGGASRSPTADTSKSTAGRHAGSRGGPARGARPNIVFVLTDDLSWNLVRYMPHVVQMQRRGETFENYFVSDSLCCPSRASILTGRFPHDTRVYDNSPPEGGYRVFHERSEEAQTFALALQRSGYRTALMGKYLNGYKPDAREGGLRRYVPPGWSEWDVAGDGYPEYGYRMNSDGRVRAYGYSAADYLTDALARKGLSFIDRSTARRRPFLLELATFAPHAPYTPARRDAAVLSGLRAPRTPAFNAIGSDEPAWLASFPPLGPSQVAVIDAKFRRRAQAVQAVDRMIGQIEARLVADGVARDTYIVLSSDNGLHMGEHRLRPGKLTAFDTDIRVPLIVTGPRVPAARTIGQMTENVDLCPSFEELAGAPVPASVDGHGLAALLHGAKAPRWRREILVEHHGRVYDHGDPDLPLRGSGNPPSYEALRARHSLYVEYDTGEREYYDLRRDPFELHNLAAQLSPALAGRLHRSLARIERCHGQRACWRAQSRTA